MTATRRYVRLVEPARGRRLPVGRLQWSQRANSRRRTKNLKLSPIGFNKSHVLQKHHQPLRPVPPFSCVRPSTRSPVLLLIRLQKVVETGQISEYPQLCNRSLSEGKKCRADPMYGTTRRRKPSEFPDMNPGKAHLGECSVVLRDTLKDFATVVC